PAAENGQADDAGTAVPDGPGGPSRAGGEIDGVEPRPRRRPGVVVPGRVGGDVEAAQGPEVDAQRPDGGELAVVRRVLQDEDVDVSVDVEELRIRRVGDVVRVRRGRHPGSLAGVDVPRPEGQRAVDRGGAEEHVDPQVLAVAAHQPEAVRLRVEVDARADVSVERHREGADLGGGARAGIDAVHVVGAGDAVELAVGGPYVDPQKTPAETLGLE